jgi:hypothetical protein
VVRIDAEALAVVLSGIVWCTDKQRVSGVVVTRHPVSVVSSLLLDAVDKYQKIYSTGEIVFDLAAPTIVEFVLNCLTSHKIGMM